MTVKMIALAAASLALFATAAHAETNRFATGPAYVVRFDKLDLTQPKDRETLLYRLEKAVRMSCNVVARADRKTCQAEKMDEVTAQSPLVREAVRLARVERGEVRLYAAR